MKVAQVVADAQEAEEEALLLASRRRLRFLPDIAQPSAFAFSAAKRVVAHNEHYAVSLDHLENGQASEAFCGKLRCNSKGTEFAIYDDSNDPYGLKTGKPRRELGIISYKKKLLGPTELIMVMPRVRKDGACAQFLPSKPEESMIQLFKAGRVDHMFILRGTANVAPGGVVELALPKLELGQGKVVFQAHKRPEGDWAVKYMHPLSCFQAFNICISIFHNSEACARVCGV